MSIEIKDTGIIISAKKYSETSLIIKILSAQNGLCSGLVRGATSNKKKIANYQIANLVDFNWKSRTEDGLGFFKIEVMRSYLANIMFNKIKLNCVKSIFYLIQKNIMEREPHEELFYDLSQFLTQSRDEESLFLSKYIKLELELLKMLGYGLDLESCALGGDKNDLYFISPKTGRAASKSMGLKYQDKLLRLPTFLYKNEEGEVNQADIKLGLKLTGFFLKKHLNYERV